LTLGIFALPELCDLAIGRMAVVQEGMTIDTKTGMLLGITCPSEAISSASLSLLAGRKLRWTVDDSYGSGPDFEREERPQLHHSDRGSQYTSEQFQRLMADTASSVR
jgi:transposase InsO family protein